MAIKEILAFRLAQYLQKKNYTLYPYSTGSRKETVDWIKKLRGDDKWGLSEFESYHLAQAFKQTAGVEGCIAEVGVWTGGSAKLLSELERERDEEAYHPFRYI